MATIKVLPSGAFQIRVVSKLHPKPFYASFDTRDEAVAFSDYLTALLAQGIVPEALAAKPGEKYRMERTAVYCRVYPRRTGQALRNQAARHHPRQHTQRQDQ